ncbi:MAG: hypothetical protein P4L46_18315, partial [Fimbriimonas sp.]|nr:hypothetical protein [Fimbriimonas sp.]
GARGACSENLPHPTLSLLGRKARERDRPAAAYLRVGTKLLSALPRPQRSGGGEGRGEGASANRRRSRKSILAFGPIIGTDWLESTEMRRFGQK